MIRSLAICLVVAATIATIIGSNALVRPEAKSSGNSASPVGDCRFLSSSPVVIDQSGHYCLNRDIVAEGDGIVVTADFVTLDLGGFTLKGPTDRTTDTVGVRANDTSNFRLTNGTVEGFGIAVLISTALDDPARGFHQVDNVRIRGSRQGGLHIRGNYSRILNNEFANIGGGPLLPAIHTHGVAVSGRGAIVSGNSFSDIYGSDVSAKAEGVALTVSGNVNGTIVEGNRFRNEALRPAEERWWPGVSPSTYAVWIGGNGLGSVTILSNTMENYINGIIVDYHVSAVAVGNSATLVAAPISGRDRKRAFQSKSPSGFHGFTPAAEGEGRPFGIIRYVSNSCNNEGLPASLAALNEVNGCISDYDISLAQIIGHGHEASIPR